MLSIIIITKNEEDRINACLESIKWGDEIIIFDNNSKDQTLEISKKYTGKIFKFENSDYAEFRNKALEKSSGEWVLYIDPDERISNYYCQECKNTGIVKEKNGVHTCLKCLMEGRLDCHSKNLPDTNIRL